MRLPRSPRRARLWDVDGNEYVDLVNGFGASLFGHSPDFVTEAVERSSDEGSRSARRRRSPASWRG